MASLPLSGVSSAHARSKSALSNRTSRMLRSIQSTPNQDIRRPQTAIMSGNWPQSPHQVIIPLNQDDQSTQIKTKDHSSREITAETHSRAHSKLHSRGSGKWNKQVKIQNQSNFIPKNYIHRESPNPSLPIQGNKALSKTE